MRPFSPMIIGLTYDLKYCYIYYPSVFHSKKKTICWGQVTSESWLMTCNQWFFQFFWYWCHYPHTLRDIVSPVCGIFRLVGICFIVILSTCNKTWSSSRMHPSTLAWTKTPKLWVGMSLIVANAVSIPTECCPQISEFMKRNWPSAAHI